MSSTSTELQVKGMGEQECVIEFEYHRPQRAYGYAGELSIEGVTLLETGEDVGHLVDDDEVQRVVESAIE